MANSTSNATAFRALAAIVALLLLIAAAFIFYQGGRAQPDAVPNLGKLVAASQAMPALARAAVAGEAGALDRLQASFADLQAGRASMPAAPGGRTAWEALELHAAAVIERAAAIETANAAQATLRSSADALATRADALLNVSGATTELQAWQLIAAGVPAEVARLTTATQPQTAAQNLDGRLGYLRDVVDALGGADTSLDVPALAPEDADAVLGSLEDDLARLETAVEQARSVAPALAGLNDDIAGLSTAAASLYDATAETQAEVAPGGLLARPLLPLALLGLALLLIGGLAWLHSRSGVFEKVAREQAEQNERNQQAILRLLDELGSLADGDLTVEATVTEDITGAIADSINYAIEKLRELVATIDRTSIMVDSAAKQTESTATDMAHAAENQGREINAATESIVSMASSIEEVSGNAERSSDVARHSVDVAHKGGEAVRRTIDGMNTIRETIQDTSKRIKRLGESSQEIGNIVELINDIAEQTNILALNASIQASMAGEAGRGFAVVADEVQRLAERSTNATRQIEVLVRTIQSDTNEAVVSMERSTTDVVGGALLAENAGAALDEIEQVSNQIASLVQNISSSARQQAGSAADVTRRTTKLKEISDQAGKATTATAASISKLSLLASQLRETVAGFTLPNSALDASPIGAVPHAAEEAEPLAPVEEKVAGQG